MAEENLPAPTKKPWMSKTLWMNAILAVVAFFPGAQEYVSERTLLMAFPVLNAILRFVTKDKIVLE